MNKIGLVTFYKDNFGSILQCYATKHCVEEFGYVCDVLSEKEPLFKKNVVYRKCKRIIFLFENIIADPSLVIRWKNNKKVPLSTYTRELMNDFVNEYIEPIVLSFPELQSIEENYIGFIVGSDQVWNANNSIDQSFFLKFTDDKKKSAFAVSFGTDNPNRKFRNIIKKGISGFRVISVREQSGIEIVNSCVNIQPTQVSDPTLMLSANEWRQFYCDKPIKDKYILVHFLNEPSELAVDYINMLSRRHNISHIIAVAYHYDIFQNLGWEYLDCNPKEYLAYIDNATYVCTDSYHTSLFCVNFDKDFFAFERQYLSGYPQTNRITELLCRYQISDRLIINDSYHNVYSTLDYNLVKEDRKKTKNYLEEVILKTHER